MSRRSELLRLFPGLVRTSFRITSPRTPSYNCIAWAAGDTKACWWPGPFTYWPRRAPKRETVTAFIAAFGTLGYTACGDDSLEDGYEKVAIYADDTGAPTHAARQLTNGRWTSKLGNLEDIEHATVRDLVGGEYGHVVVVIKRHVRHNPR